MPNHVRNEIYFDSRADEILEVIKGENGIIDFNKIIPMPKELDIESGSRGEHGYESYCKYVLSNNTSKEEWIANNDIDKECFELGEKYYNNVRYYGAKTWYEWCWDNWGTKWNAYDIEFLDEGTFDGVEFTSSLFEYDGRQKGVMFSTAWNAPIPVIGKLSEMFPNVTITHYFADECMNENCGKIMYRNGCIIFETDWEDMVSNVKETIKFAQDIWDVEVADIDD